jgi:dihydrofolate reductase
VAAVWGFSAFNLEYSESQKPQTRNRRQGRPQTSLRVIAGPPGDCGTLRRMENLGPFALGLTGSNAMTRKRKIIVWITTSADRFIARSDGAIDWLDRPRPKGNYGMGVFYASIDTTLWGRNTYDMALDYQKKGVSGTAFDTNVKNYVFTHRVPQSPPAGVEFVRESIKAFATRLRAEKGKDIWIMGGAGIIGSFLDAGEIDEFMINVIPKFIGEGIPLMAPGHRTVPLKLIRSVNFPDGVVRMHYAIPK